MISMSRLTMAAALALPWALPMPAAAAAEASTTLEDQVDVAVTIYNNDLALVRDRRALTLPTGVHSLQFEDVAERIRPETVGIQSLAQPGSVAVLEQNYEYDLMSPDKLLEKYVGKQVQLRNLSTDYDFALVDATLLSVNNGPIYEVDGEIYLGHPGQVILPEIPDNLIAKPTLVWLLENTRAEQEIEATYLTGGMSWKADYVLTLDRNDTEFDIAGWVTLNNNSGATYKNAELKVVAGEVHRVRDEVPKIMAMRAEADMAAAAPPRMEQEAFAEYHLYTLPRRTTIRQNQSKQVSLLTANGVQCEKVYEFRGRPHYYHSRQQPMSDQRAEVFLKFENEEDNQLGVPLPKGVIRIYQEDQSGALQFAGEDNINHTPRNEEVRIKMGNAFDVVGERIHKEWRELGARTFESEFEISIRNRKEEAITVHIVEPIPGDWTILESSHEYTKKDAFTVIFEVPAGADEEVTVSYRVRVRL